MPQPTRFSALLNVKDGAAAIAFYERAFGAKVLFCTPPESGSVVANLAVDAADFWLADEAIEYANPSPTTLVGTSVRLFLIVEDPDALIARAVAAGATIVSPVADRDYGWRDGRVSDPFGHHWEIGKPLQRT